MPKDLATVTLMPEMFGRDETVIARHGRLVASTFRYTTGVAGLRIRNAAGMVELLPFQGQQIWRASFFGRGLTMRSMFDEPVPTQDYLSTYGAFFLHCGVTAMGNPGPTDTHPLHGELPNAAYQSAELLIGSDESGRFLGLSGSYRHALAFAHSYRARPELRLHEDNGRIHLSLDVENMKATAMELMYLAHANFLPVDGGRIVDAVVDDRRDLKLRMTLPPIFKPPADFMRLREAILTEPDLHRRLPPGTVVDPELVFAIVQPADPDGWSHALQIHPDGGADFISYRPDELPRGVRWMVRNADQDALGLVLPATAEADGYEAEKAKGHLIILDPGQHFRCRLVFGALRLEEVPAFERAIAAARSRGR